MSVSNTKMVLEDVDIIIDPNEELNIQPKTNLPYYIPQYIVDYFTTNTG